jgi:Domain of unknown function (DUF5666)
MNRVALIVAGVLVLAVVGGACFYGGMLYGKSQAQTPTISADYSAAPGQNAVPPTGGQFFRGDGQGGARQGGTLQGGMVSGQILDIGNGVMTVTDSSGNQVQVYVTDTTLIQRQASLSLGDLQKGETVIVSGSQGSDGSVTARSVQVTTGATGATGVPGGQPGRNPGGNAP